MSNNSNKPLAIWAADIAKSTIELAQELAELERVYPNNCNDKTDTTPDPNLWHGECPYFPINKDVKCPCSRCKEEETPIKIYHYNKMVEARVLAGVPFVVNSWTRCKAHNKDVGGSATSSHLLGLATDIATPDSATRFIILKALLDVGFERIGIYPNFIHVDSDTSKPAGVMWYHD